MKRLEIAKAAEADLAEISRYTEERWGIAQKRRYLAAIKDCFFRLRRNPALGASRDDIRPGYRSISAARHVVFYREALDRIEIIRVLHARMDLNRRLTEE